jgi:hypothetical protein
MFQPALPATRAPVRRRTALPSRRRWTESLIGSEEPAGPRRGAPEFGPAHCSVGHEELGSLETTIATEEPTPCPAVLVSSIGLVNESRSGIVNE